MYIPYTAPTMDPIMPSALYQIHRTQRKHSRYSVQYDCIYLPPTPQTLLWLSVVLMSTRIL